MDSGLAIALVLALILLILAIGGFMLIIRNRDPIRYQASTGPAYKHDLGVVQYSGYFRTDSAASTRTAQNEGVAHEALRNVPLPRCEVCGSALAFGDNVCHKCGNASSHAPLKR